MEWGVTKFETLSSLALIKQQDLLKRPISFLARSVLSDKFKGKYEFIQRGTVQILKTKNTTIPEII